MRQLARALRSRAAALAALLTVATVACGGGTSTDPQLDGLWVGEASADNERTRLVIHLREQPDALAADLSLPDIGVSGWPAVQVERVDDIVTLHFPSDSGVQVMTLTRNADEMSGTWAEPRFATPAQVSLRLDRDRVEPIEERIGIEGPAGLLAASVILPAGTGPFPGVVFLHGSGPQPRDASRFAALALADRGIASAIFDKRGVGESGSALAGASFDDLAADGIAVARHLLARPDIAAVGFFGHSQGGWIGPLAGSLWPETAFVITSAGPAVPPSREGHWQVVRNLRQAEAGAEAERQARRVIDLWHDGVRSSDWTAFDSAMAVAERAPWFDTSGLSGFAERPASEFADSYRVFMDYDPLPALRGLNAPLLAILAPDDESIDAVETEGILSGLIAEGHDITLKLFPGYDHTLRRTGSDETPLRWPQQPADLYDVQAEFVESAIRTSEP